MSQNQEIIESKLCAYIDGELDSEGRAEIEKHLEANPQHRRLLESLRATRDLIRWLPREPAPPEVAETLSGQLERSVLLNYEGDSLRTSPWPRIFAVAAIVLLTTGLGVAVYYALPRSQKAPQLAFHSENAETNTGDVVPAPAGPELRNDSFASTDATAADREADKMKSGAVENLKKDGNLVAAKLADETKQSAGNITSNTSNTDLDQLAEQVGQNPAAYLASAENANDVANNFARNTSNTVYNNSANMPLGQNAAPATPNAVVLLVRSDQPERTEKQLSSYLTQQQIQWRQPAQGQQQPDVLRRQQTEQRDKLSLGTQPGGPEATQQGRDASARPSETESSTAKDRSSFAAKGGGWREGGAPTAPAPATTQPAQVESARALRAAQNGNDQQQSPAPSDASITTDRNSVFVCTMSRRQAEQLSVSFGNDSLQGAQVQNVYGMAYNNNFERNAMQNGYVGGRAPDQAQNQASGPGGGLGERERMARAAGGSTPAPALQPSVDGAIQQKREIALTTQPAGAPSFSLNSPAPAEKALNEGPSTRPGNLSGEVAQHVAATQPSAGASLASTTAPADESVNVVIMVQPSGATSTAAAAPSTQPASEPLPQKAQAPPSQQLPALK